jgi:hypothetical protein
MSLDINLTGVEATANKSTNVNTDQASNTKYPSVKAVFDWAVGLFVPTSRTVNGQALSSDVTLTASDVGAPSGSGTSTGTNTGDETKTTIHDKLGIFEAKLTSGNQTTTTNFTQIAITELKVTPTINKRYKVTAQLHLGCSGSGGVRVGISIPTGASIFITGFGTGQPGLTNSLMSFINASGQLFQNPYVTLNSTNGMCIINGEIEMGSTAGDVQLTFNSFN